MSGSTEGGNRLTVSQNCEGWKATKVIQYSHHHHAHWNMSLSAKELGAGAPCGTLGTGSVLVTRHCHTGKGQHETSLTLKERRKGYIYTYICCLHTASLYSLPPAVQWLEASQLWQSLQPVFRSKVPRAWKVDVRITVRGKTLKEGCPQIPLPSGTSPTTSCFPWITPCKFSQVKAYLAIRQITVVTAEKQIIWLALKNPSEFTKLCLGLSECHFTMPCFR